MNWQAKISEKEMTLLCEYLDDALSIKDRAIFEKHLQQSPELKEALADMTALKHNMRNLPCKPVPHHFTLTRSEAEKARRGRFLLPTFGWASMVSMILLAAIFGSEFIFTNFSAPQSPAEPLAMALPMEAAPESTMRETDSASAEPVYLLNWGSVGGKGGGGGGGVAYGMGGGMTGIYAGDVAVAEPIQPEVSIMNEPSPPGETPAPTEVTTGPAEELITVEPLIFGVREDQLGQVITIEPDTAQEQGMAAIPEESEPARENLISTNVKLILVGLAAAFGLVWLLLKLKR